MYCIDVLLEEHDRITDFIVAARNACCNIIDGNNVDLEDLKKMLEFGKNYADNLHHKKEEDILFDAMVNEVGGPAQKMIQNGMLVEHNLGRLYLSELEKAIIEDSALLEVIDKIMPMINKLSKMQNRCLKKN